MPMDCVTYMKLAGITFISSYDEEAPRNMLREPLFTITGSFEGLSIYRMKNTPNHGSIDQKSANKSLNSDPQ